MKSTVKLFIMYILLIIGGVDYMSFNEIITLYPGNTTFQYRVLIMADSEDENDEMFQAMITLESGGGVIINDQADTATITIQDLNRMLCVYMCVTV